MKDLIEGSLFINSKQLYHFHILYREPSVLSGLDNVQHDILKLSFLPWH